MGTLKYTIIRNRAQYNEYCQILETLVESSSTVRQTVNKSVLEEIDLLTLLIEKWDEEHNSFNELDPIRLLRSFMNDHNMKAKDLVDLLEVSKGYVSDILNYKKGLSKVVIRKLSKHFKVSQEAFNRPYKLVSPVNSRLRNASIMNTKKEMGTITS